MSKTIAFCADGTWDSPQENTNVYTLFKSLRTTSSQVAYYDDGVGSDGTPLEKLTGGALGDGLFQKIKDGYTKIAHVYDAKDDIFIFGFSRGAFTARSLAGMIAVCGLPTANFDDNLVESAFAAYREKDPEKRKTMLQGLASYQLFDAKIKMVGVWDTVGALGIPALFGGIDEIAYGFLDTGLHPDVLNAFHALSIDERRQEFPPTLWTPLNPPVQNQIIEQIWFSGVHCDVGGGYAETGLSNITLGWMMKKATALELDIDPTVLSQYADFESKFALDTIHESWNVLWLFPKRRQISNTSTLGNSVAIRCQHANGYQPPNLLLTAGVPGNSYQVEQVVTPV